MPCWPGSNTGTILNLGSHVRNLLGNVSFATLAGSNP